MTEPTVHIVDDDTSFLLAIARLLRASGFRVETYASATAFLDQRRGDEPGCVIADLHMPEVDGLDLQSAWRKPRIRCPPVPDRAGGHGVHRARDAGRRRRLSREDRREEPSPRRGAPGAGSRPAGGARSGFSNEPCVCASMPSVRREREVLGHVLRGSLNKQIAGDLGIHERTVKVHRKSIMTKLNVRSVAALALLSQEAGVSWRSPPSPRCNGLHGPLGDSATGPR
jgi:FixJ family two-component response regulator